MYCRTTDKNSTTGLVGFESRGSHRHRHRHHHIYLRLPERKATNEPIELASGYRKTAKRQRKQTIRYGK